VVGPLAIMLVDEGGIEHSAATGTALDALLTVCSGEQDDKVNFILSAQCQCSTEKCTHSDLV
jgi:hypothetical protein